MIAVLRQSQDERVWRVLGMEAPLGQAVMLVDGGGQAVGWWFTEQGREFWVSVRPGYTTHLCLLFRR